MHDFPLENPIQTEFFHQEKYIRKFQCSWVSIYWTVHHWMKRTFSKMIRKSLFESIYSAIQRRRKICLSAENMDNKLVPCTSTSENINRFVNPMHLSKHFYRLFLSLILSSNHFGLKWIALQHIKSRRFSFPIDLNSMLL